MVLAASLSVNAVNIEEKPLKGLKEHNSSSLFAALNKVKEQMMTINSLMMHAESFFETDELIEIEDWMLEPEVFATQETTEETFVLDEYYYEDYTEEALELEPWMLSAESVDLEYFETDYEEESLPIEDWMINF